jgi:hypothetical protein
VAPDWRPFKNTGNGGNWRLYAVQQLGSGDKHDAGAGYGEQPAAGSRIRIEIVTPAFNRAERNGINHQPRLEARLDLEQTTDLFQHHHR